MEAGTTHTHGASWWLRHCLVTVTLYYAVVGCAVWALVTYAPDFSDTLPVGGVDDMLSAEEETARSLEEIVATAIGGDDYAEARDLIFAIVGSIILMVPIAWVYEGTRARSAVDRALLETILVLPIIVSGIVLIVQHSLALAFSLAGIVAGVQFRRSLQMTGDSLYIFVAIAIGLAAGVKALEIAGIISLGFSYASLATFHAGYGYHTDELAEDGLTGGRKKKKRRKKPDHEPSPEGPTSGRMAVMPQPGSSPRDGAGRSAARPAPEYFWEDY